MIGTRVDFDEALQPIYATQYRLHSAKAFVARHSRIVWMAGHAHFVFLRHGNHTIQKVSDALPISIIIHRPGFREWRILAGLIVYEGAVAGAAAAARGLGPNHSKNVQVVLEGRNSGLGRVVD